MKISSTKWTVCIFVSLFAAPAFGASCDSLTADDLIQHRRFRTARPVRGVDSHEGVA